MHTPFHAGFADELVKGAGIRDIVKRIVHGKPVPKMGFFEKRRLAKVLGVKSDDVARTLLERQKKDRLAKGVVAGGGLTLGALGGSALNKEADDPYAKYTPQQQTQLRRRDDLMKARQPTYTPDQQKMLDRRDTLMKQRQPKPATAQDLLARRDALMKQRQPKPAAAPKPPVPVASLASAFGR